MCSARFNVSKGGGVKLDRNQTIWQRLRTRMQTADGECLDAGERGLTEAQKDAITRALHPYVLAERGDAKGGHHAR